MLGLEKHPRLDLINMIREIEDPRIDRTRCHNLVDILGIAICALWCGADSLEDMALFGECKKGWLGTFLELPNGIPSHDTFGRVFAASDPKKFLEALMRWTQSVGETLSAEMVAIDGKALRRAIDQGQSPKVIVSAWAAGNGLVLGQRKVDDKSNEITAVPELLRSLEWACCIVMLDAMGCRNQIAREIIEADADSVLAIKGNQAAAHEEISAFLDDFIERKDPALDDWEPVKKGHRRIETRRYWQSDRIDWFAGKAAWE